MAKVNLKLVILVPIVLRTVFNAKIVQVVLGAQKIINLTAEHPIVKTKPLSVNVSIQTTKLSTKTTINVSVYPLSLTFKENVNAQKHFPFLKKLKAVFLNVGTVKNKMERNVMMETQKIQMDAQPDAPLNQDLFV